MHKNKNATSDRISSQICTCLSSLLFYFYEFWHLLCLSRGFSTQNILQVLSSLSQVILKQVRVLHLVNAKMAWAPSSPPVTKIPIFQVKFFEILVPHFSQLSQQRAVTNKRPVCGATPLGLSGVAQLGQISKTRRKLNLKIRKIGRSYFCLQQFDNF